MTASCDPARAALDGSILEWMREERWTRDDARFEKLALDVFAFQFAHCAPYRRFCEGRGGTPDSVVSWRDVPPVPTGAFKEMALRSFPEERTVKTFRTSGTSTRRRGELHLDSLTLYEASLLPSFRRFALAGLDATGGRPVIRVLTPSPEEAADSSLSHMFGRIVAEAAAEPSGFDVVDGELRVDALLAALQRASAAGSPVVVCGTAFAFVHLGDALAKRGDEIALPEGSRVMETGGFKGRSRELSRDALYTLIERSLGVPASHIVNQYGMTELGSQFYDSNLHDPGEPRRKLGPPWTRTLVIDPETRRPVMPGGVGTIVLYDLANTGSVFAIETADLGREIADGFEVLGREAGAEARGCSIAADELLGEAP
ncbi:MAG: long-chain fatty acid--CoA ligase [Myxococcales bacterium]|nr:long-chain fatty acid--CoA ligase [Myxococcales bacterium]